MDWSNKLKEIVRELNDIIIIKFEKTKINLKKKIKLELIEFNLSLFII